MTKRYEAIDGLRMFSCIGIVAMHVLANSNYALKGFAFECFIPRLTNLVFLFMTISAFGLCCGYYEKMINGKIDIVSFYKKRYKKILPFFALLCLLDFIVSPSISAIYEIFANLTLCFGLIPNASITVIGVGWFLGTVFVFYLLFPFFCFLLADKRRAWFALAASYVMNYLCRVYFNADRKSIAYCFVYFMMGGLVYLYKDRIEAISFSKYLAAIMLVLSIVFYYLVSPSTLIMLLINATALVLAISTNGKGILNNKFTGFIGGISFEIYLCHMFVYRICEKLHLLSLLANEYWNYCICLLVVLIGAIVFAYVGQIFINKVMKMFAKKD